MSSTIHEISRGLPEFFKNKLSEITEKKDGVLEAEVSIYKEAVLLAQKINFNLPELLKFATLPLDQQTSSIPALANSSHVITLRTPTFLKAVEYVCYQNEEDDPLKRGDFEGTDAKLPIYFLRRYKASQEKECLLPLFEEAVRTVEQADYRIAAVIYNKKHDLLSEVALHAIRYTCYVENTPGAKPGHLTSQRGSRVKVLPV